MANPLLTPDTGGPIRRLLGGWRDVLDEIHVLCRKLEGLPNVCQCGHGTGHLADRCPCCGTTTTVRIPPCDDCEEELKSLRAFFDALAVDTYRFFPVVENVMGRHDPEDGRRAREIERQIAQLVRSFEDLVLANGQFQSDCRASHVETLRQSAAALRRDADALDRLVSPISGSLYAKD